MAKPTLKIPGPKKSGQKKEQTFERATMNFARGGENFNFKTMIPLLAVIVLIGGLGLKFGFLDMEAGRGAVQDELAQKQLERIQQTSRLNEYDALFQEYGKYSYGWMTENETNAVERLDVLRLIEEKIMPKAVISNLSINDNTLTLNLSGITLEETSEIVKNLESDKLVKSASVYSAAAPDGEEATIFMSVTMLGTDEQKAAETASMEAE